MVRLCDSHEQAAAIADNAMRSDIESFSECRHFEDPQRRIYGPLDDSCPPEPVQRLREAHPLVREAFAWLFKRGKAVIERDADGREWIRLLGFEEESAA
jgi:hypothetical protein